MNRFQSAVLISVLALWPFYGCANPSTENKVIIFVWDGLRPDSINSTDTPNLYKLRESGVNFTDNHSTYPTFTMMNASSFASGSFSGKTGYYGNTLWQPNAKGNDFANKQVDFRQPVFTEDYAVLTDLNSDLKGDLFLIETLFQAAQKAGMTTATIGKSGAAYIQDYKRGGMVFDEKTVLPLSLAKELQNAGIALPITAPNTYSSDALILTSTNGDPTHFEPIQKMKDGVTPDPTNASGSPYAPAIQYMMDVYFNFILPKKDPKLTVLWSRNPDTTQHRYGVGSANYRDALRRNDQILGELQAKLKALGLEKTTDIIVVSDHAHSNVAGSNALFPLRAINNGTVGDIDPKGYSVSGLVRLADLLRRAGFAAFDGFGCSYLPVGSGIKADGTPVYPTLIDKDGSICGTAGEKYLTAPLKVPAILPHKALVVAVNGGSDYIYVPDHDADTVRKAVRFLQSRDEVGAIFVDSRYGNLPGTLSLNTVQVENTGKRNPDIIIGYDYDENAVINGMKGTEYSGILLNTSYRGMHGSFSPRDVHNTLIAYGPDFRHGFKDTLPTGNVDVAPTVAFILGLPFTQAAGRPLLEALKHGLSIRDYKVVSNVIKPTAAATGIIMKLPTDPNGSDIDKAKNTYTVELNTKSLTVEDKIYTYFDYAKALRQ